MAFCGIAELEPIIEIDTSKAEKAKRDMVLQKLYYTPGAYYKNAKLLRDDAREHGYDFSLRDINEWIKKQAIWQVYAPTPKYIPHVSFNNITVPNEVHMADICEVPPDKFGNNTFPYMLCIIDVASSFGWAILLTNKLSKKVAKAFILIYDSPVWSLVWPKLLITDKSMELLGCCKELMQKHGIRRQIAKSKNGLAHCNRFMRTVEEKYIPLQYAQEMLLPLSERSHVLIRILDQILIKIANTKNCKTGLPPAEAIKKKNVYRKSVPVHRPIGFEEERLKYNDSVRYLLKPGELEVGPSIRRAGDLIWSPYVYRIGESLIQKK